VFAEDFESPSALVRAEVDRDHRLKLIDGAGVGASRGLRVTYVGGPMGSERVVKSVPLTSPGTEFTLSYDVRFDRDFQFVNGGKLHGLGPQRPVTGGDAIRPEGWSSRVMWRKDGRIETYTYHQDQKGKYGDAGRALRIFRFSPGKYHAISLHMRLNQPASASNGFARLYVDGELVETREELRFRAVDTPDTLISRFLFSTFHGGNNPSWAPRSPDGSYANVTADFDNFIVSRGESIRRRPGA
jgi:hypothetical protein